MQPASISPYEKGTAIPVTGRDGATMAEKWQDGALTMHGIHVHGFPNFFISGTRQGSWDNNFRYSQEMVATHVATSSAKLSPAISMRSR